MLWCILYHGRYDAYDCIAIAIDTTATRAVVSADSPRVPKVDKDKGKDEGMPKMEKEKDMRTPPPILKEALGDIYGDGSREEVEGDNGHNGHKPLAATQGSYLAHLFLYMG